MSDIIELMLNNEKDKSLARLAQLTLNNYKNYWKTFLKFLNEKAFLEHPDVEENPTFLSYIMDCCDFIQEGDDQILYEPGTDDIKFEYWNPSINELYRQYIENFVNNINNQKKEVYELKDQLETADAGEGFEGSIVEDKLDSEYEWVRSSINQNNQIFQEIRNSDSNEDTSFLLYWLNNKSNLQFTNSKDTTTILQLQEDLKGYTIFPDFNENGVIDEEDVDTVSQLYSILSTDGYVLKWQSLVADIYHDKRNDVFDTNYLMMFLDENSDSDKKKYQPFDLEQWILFNQKEKIVDDREDLKMFSYTQIKEQIQKGLRLLIPKYSRHVVVEDLNRNFWVISQCLSKIMDFLFGDDGPYAPLLKGILSELAQLWENILHLWTQTALLSQQKNVGGTYFEVLPLPNNSLQHYRKYDGFDEFEEESLNELCEYILSNPNSIDSSIIKSKIHSAAQAIINRIDYIKDKNSADSYCIVPFIRLNNYTYNYFATMFFPLVAWYINNEWSYTILTCHDNNEPADTQKPVIIDLQGRYGSREYLSHIVGIRELEDYTCEWGSPLSDLDNIDETTSNDTTRYYGFLRLVPEITYSEQAQLTIEQLSLTFYDGGRQSIRVNEQPKANAFYFKKFSYDTEIVEGTMLGGSLNPLNVSLKVEPQNKGFYLGEVPSWYQTVVPPVITNADLEILKIGDFYPMEYILSNNIKSPYKGTFRLTQQQTRFNYETSGHDGYDMRGVSDINLYSPIDGYLHFQGWQDNNNHYVGFGYYVCIRTTLDPNDPNALFYYFGHMEEATEAYFIKDETINAYPVKKGQQIGIEGSTGEVSGRHCHYCIRSKFSAGNDSQRMVMSNMTGIPNQIGLFGINDTIFQVRDTDFSSDVSKTYGVGGYTYNQSTKSGNWRNNFITDLTANHQNYTCAGRLKLIRYNLEPIKKSNNTYTYNYSKTNFSNYYTNEVYMNDLQEWGIQYAQQCIIASNMDINKDHFFVTKIGVSYWTSRTLNSEWVYGLLGHIIVYDGTTHTATCMGDVSLFDGFWTDNHTVFSYVNGSRWRRVAIKGTIKKKSVIKDGVQENEFTLKNGYLAWYDHNREDLGARVMIPIKLVAKTDSDGNEIINTVTSTYIDANGVQQTIEQKVPQKRIIRDSDRECVLGQGVVWNHSTDSVLDKSKGGTITLNDWFDAAFRENNTPNNIESGTKGGRPFEDRYGNEVSTAGGIVMSLKSLDNTSVRDPISSAIVGRQALNYEQPEIYFYHYKGDNSQYWLNRNVMWNDINYGPDTQV